MVNGSSGSRHLEAVKFYIFFSSLNSFNSCLPVQVQQEQELQEQFARQGLLNTLLRVVEECRLTAEQKRTLLPVVIDRVRHHWRLLQLP